MQVHEACGLGIYSFFHVHENQNPQLRLKSAIEAPMRKDVRIIHVSTIFGRSGGVDHPVNLQGEPTNREELKLFGGINLESQR